MNVAFDYDHSSDQSPSDTVPRVAQRLKARNTPWALIVDQNYGEGSAREHAALQPRFYGKCFLGSIASLLLALTIGRLRDDCRSLICSYSRDKS